jgi:2-oxoglutarate dehydrogenase E1 component
LHKRNETARNDVAIVRIEQLFPLPDEQLEELLKKYSKQVEIIWVQEEPENMGAWSFICMNLRSKNLSCISRKKSASPATGFKKSHDSQQAEIVEKAFS